MSGERLKFRAKSEHEQAELSDDDLVAYLVAARDSGQDAQFRLAAGILVFRRYEVQLNIIRTRVTSGEDAEDLVTLVMEQTIRASFEGEHAGEFFQLMNTIRRRRLADYYEAKKRQLDIDHGRPDDPPAIDEVADGDDFATASDFRIVMEDVLVDYSGRNRMVVERRMDGMSSKETAESVAASGVDGGEAITPANVDQIFSRFKKKMREALSDQDDDTQPAGTV